MQRTQMFYRTILMILFLYPAESILAQDCNASFTWISENLKFNFSDQSTIAANDEIISWEWDFDDDTFSSLQNPTHTFLQAKVYNVELKISTANGCEDKLKIKVEPCALGVDFNLGHCDMSGLVPIQINITDVYDNAKEIIVSIDDMILPGSPFMIDAESPASINSSLLGDGLSHQLSVQSTDIEGCKQLIDIDLENCNSDCILSALHITPSGGNRHTVHIGDNFFNPVITTIVLGDVVDFIWQGNGHSTTSDATSGPDSWNSGEIGTGSTFSVTITNPGVHRFYCIPHGGPGGIGMSGSIVANCPDDNNLNLLVTFNTTVAGALGYEVLINQIPLPGGPFSYNGIGNQQLNISIPNDGKNKLIEIVDLNDTTCILSQTYNSADCGASPGCSLSLAIDELGLCNPDNSITASFSIMAINPGTNGYNLSIDGVPSSSNPYSYHSSENSKVTIDFPGDGGSHLISIQDIDNSSCTASITVNGTDCSQPCTLSSLELQPSNTTKTHTIEVRDFEFFPKTLDVQVGDKVSFIWKGQVAHTSTSDATTGADVWNSGLLNQGSSYEITINSLGSHPYYCIPHGSPGGTGMSGVINALPPCHEGNVTIGLQFVSVNGSASGYNVLRDNQIQTGSPFGYSQNNLNQLVLNAPGDGKLHIIEIQDANDSNCSVSQNFQTQDCSLPPGPCHINLLLEEVGNCNANEEVSINLNINSDNQGSGYQIYLNDILYQETVFKYHPSNTSTQAVTVSGLGQNINLEVRDIDSLNCKSGLELELPLCGQSCLISNAKVSQSTPAKHIIEVRDFEFSPKNIVINLEDTVIFVWVGQILHTSTSDKISGIDSWNSGLLNRGAQYEIIPSTVGVHPYYCIPHGAPGGEGMAGSIEVVDPCQNQSLKYDITFRIQQGGSAGFHIFADNTEINASPRSYLPQVEQSTIVFLPADGQIHEISIIDVENNSCRWDSSFIVPDCTDECFGFKTQFLFNTNLVDNQVIFMDSTKGFRDKWMWDFGDGSKSNLQHPVHQYPAAGLYNVCLITENTAAGCRDSFCQQIEIGIFSCEAKFNYQLSGLTIQFEDASLAKNAITNWIYDLGTGIQLIGEANPIFTFDSLGIYNICLNIDTDSCQDVYCLELDLSDPCLDFSSEVFITNLDDELSFQFVEITKGQSDQWLWGFGDGTTTKEQNPKHVYKSTGHYRVCLLAQNTQDNCNFVACELIEVGTVSTKNPNKKKASLIVYPNPASTGQHGISFKGIAEEDINSSLIMHIHSINGQLMQKEKLLAAEKTKIELSKNLPTGIYLIKLLGKQNIYYGKLVID